MSGCIASPKSWPPIIVTILIARQRRFAVNQIVHKSNDRLEADLVDLCEMAGSHRHHLAGRP